MQKQNTIKLCLADVWGALFGSSIWLYMAWQDIKQRYRRSTLGPFWITISTGAMLSAMGPLYGRLFHQDVGPYFQYISVSFVIWLLISGIINEGCTTFISNESTIKNVNMPLSMHLIRIMTKNLIMYGHNLLFVFSVLYFFPPDNMCLTLLAIPGLFLVMLNLFWMGLILATICTRFRDVTQIVGSIVQIAFFLTPIMWNVNMLGDHQFIANWNMLYHLIELVRAPLLGHAPNTLSWWVVSGSAIIGTIIAILFFAKFRNRIVYWL